MTIAQSITLSSAKSIARSILPPACMRCLARPLPVLGFAIEGLCAVLLLPRIAAQTILANRELGFDIGPRPRPFGIRDAKKLAQIRGICRQAASIPGEIEELAIHGAGHEGPYQRR